MMGWAAMVKSVFFKGSDQVASMCTVANISMIAAFLGSSPFQ
jgi:hypothetical protein